MKISLTKREPMSTPLYVRLTASHRKAVESLAEECGVPVADVLRALIGEALKRMGGVK
jgi:hypothetical protein